MCWQDQYVVSEVLVWCQQTVVPGLVGVSELEDGDDGEVRGRGADGSLVLAWCCSLGTWPHHLDHLCPLLEMCQNLVKKNFYILKWWIIKAYHSNHFLHHLWLIQVCSPSLLSFSYFETRSWFVSLTIQDGEQSQFFFYESSIDWNEIPRKELVTFLNDRWGRVASCNLCPVFNILSLLFIWFIENAATSTNISVIYANHT